MKPIEKKSSQSYPKMKIMFLRAATDHGTIKETALYDFGNRRGQQKCNSLVTAVHTARSLCRVNVHHYIFTLILHFCLLIYFLGCQGKQGSLKSDSESHRQIARDVSKRPSEVWTMAWQYLKVQDITTCHGPHYLIGMITKYNIIKKLYIIKN